MFRIKRFAYVLLIVAAISIGAIFLNSIIFKVNNNQASRQAYAVSEFKLLNAEVAEGVPLEKTLIVYDNAVQSDASIYHNVAEAAAALKLNCTSSTRVRTADLQGINTLVIALHEYADCISPVDIAEFVMGGGNVLFAAGVAEDARSAYLQPVMGIVEKGYLYNFNGLQVEDGFFPTAALEVSKTRTPYSTTSLRLSDQCEVYVQANDRNPLVWTLTYRSGRVGVINGNILEDDHAIGLFCAALALTQDGLIYPVIGTQTVFLDGYPPQAASANEKLIEYYGRDSEAVVRDVLWPSFLQAAMENDIRYSAFFTGLADYSVSTKLRNERLLTSNVKEIIQNGGEIAVGSADSAGEADLAALNRFMTATVNSIFKDYRIRCYLLLDGTLSHQARARLKVSFPDVSVLRGTYFGDPKTQPVQRFGVEDGMVNYPSITNGYIATQESTFTRASLLSLYGAVSHSFPIDELLNPQSNEQNWRVLEKQFTNLCAAFFRESDWLKSVTASEGAGCILSYAQVKPVISKQNGVLTVYCKDFTIGQTFFLWSKENLEAIKGCTAHKIAKNYYLVKATEPRFEIGKGD